MCALIIIRLSLYQEMTKTYLLGAGMAKAVSSSLCTPAPAHQLWGGLVELNK